MSDSAIFADPQPFDRLREELAPTLELLRPLGEGSVSRVFLAREPALKRTVAVKVLREEVAADNVSRQRFEREAQATASLTHPNITGIYRVGHLADGIPYIVMEHVEGRTLDALLASRGPFRPDDARRILASVAAALKAAHRKAIVHRDVRPGNIMLETETDRVVLMDFGLAALVQGGTQTVVRLTVAGEQIGDPLHMSPEQLRGEPVTQESDVYGLGVLAYELLTGAGPFGALTEGAAVAAHLGREPTPLNQLRPDVDPELAEIVRRCLAKQPQHRPRSAEAFEALVRTPAPPLGYPTPLPQPAVQPGALTTIPVLHDFVAEVQRRHVARMAAAYIAGAFILLQGADLIIPGLPVRDPDLWYRATLAVTLAGFPIAMVLSWLFDVSSSGIRRTSLGGTEQPRMSARRLLLPIVGLAASVLLAVTLWVVMMR